MSTVEWYPASESTWHVQVGVDWNESTSSDGMSVVLAPDVLRWDSQDTNNYGSRFWETLSPDPSGAGSWSGNSWGSGSGSRVVDTFNARRYAKRASSYTVTMTVGWDSSFGTYYNGSFHTIGSDYNSFEFAIPAAPTPDAPTNLSYSRESDSRVNVSWTASTSYKTSVLVERKVDGGQWSQVASLSASATSWQDTTTSADHTYSYRVRVTNGVNYSSYATSASVITMTPSAPTSISLARASSAGTDVAAAIVNQSATATSLVWEKQAQGSDAWETGGTIQGVVTSFTATSLGGVYRLRVKNANATGSSAWLVSDYITTICPPNPPTLVNPSGIVSLADANIVFSWLHNAIDGSPQTAAQLRYKVGSGSWTTQTLTTAQTYTLATSTFSAGASITWQVRTKGVDASYSEWSSTNQFSVYQVPSLSFVAGNPPSTVTTMPIPCSVTYSDPQGMACASATVTLYDGQSSMFSEEMTISGGTLSASLDVSEFLPENGKTYTVGVVARSGSTLQANVSTEFTVSYTPPKAATLLISNDAETGNATILVSEVPDSVGANISRIDVYRVTGHRQKIMLDASIGQSATDIYAPLNTEYSYEIITYAESGAICATIVANTIRTRRWFAMWGGNIAYATWNPEEGGIELTRPEKVHVRYSGRMDPVSYDGAAFGESRSMSFLAVDESEAPAFRRLMEDGGRGVFKSCDGDVYHADFAVTLSPAYTERAYYGGIEVEITKIAGDSL